MMSLLRRLEEKKGDFSAVSILENTNVSSHNQTVMETTNRQPIALNDNLTKAKERIRNQTIAALNDVKEPSDNQIREKLEEFVHAEGSEIPRTERVKIIEEILNDITGYGPLESVLSDPTVTEVMVNGPSQIYIEASGKIRTADFVFRNQDHLMTIIDRIVSSIGRHVDEASPMVDARLKDGSRVNVILPPLSLVGPVLTIRKFSKIPFTAAKLVEFGSVSPKMVAFLEACVKGRLNIIVSGGTGSGKTTLLNVLSSLSRKMSGS